MQNGVTGAGIDESSANKLLGMITGKGKYFSVPHIQLSYGPSKPSAQ
jgi:hypothetical protein